MSAIISPVASHQHGFLELLPKIQRYAQFAFRGLRADTREDAIAETVAAAFVAFLQLRRRQKDPSQYPSVLARFAILHVRGYRQVAGKSGAREVLSRKVQRRYGFEVHSLYRREPILSDGWQDAVVDNTQSPVPDQASFRLAFPTFLESLSPRDRKIACFMGQGNSAKEAAIKFGLSGPRITQLRQQWRSQWRRLHNELAEDVKGRSCDPQSLAAGG